MEEHDQAGVDQPNTNGDANGTPSGSAATDTPGDGAERDRRRQFDEVTHAYERARDELNEAVRSLRLEIARIDFEQARTRAKSWVDENPALAVFIGVGAGILTGKVLSSAFHHEPPTFSERARLHADVLRDRAAEYTDEVSGALAYQLGRAARSAGDVGEQAAHRGADVADDLSRRARDVGKDVSDRARRAGKEFSRRAEEAGRDASRRAAHLSDDASRRAEDLAHSLSDSTARSVHVLEEATDELARTLRKQSKQARKRAKKNVEKGLDFSGTVVNAARTAVAAVVVKKVNDWMRAVR